MSDGKGSAKNVLFYLKKNNYIHATIFYFATIHLIH